MAKTLARHWCRGGNRLTELDIGTLRFVARGYSSKEIANLCCVDKETIDERLYLIHKKLVVSSSFEAWIIMLKRYPLEYEPSKRTDIKRIRLTKRESEVLTLLGQGQIATRIGRNLNTKKRMVDFHLSNIFQRLGVHNRYDAVKEGVRRGFILRPGS